MQYPLTENIGEPSLLVGREQEFRNFGKWLAKIEKRLSKSRAILARRKSSGKTAFVQRLFNQLWTANGMVIPFYFEFGETADK
jgi:Cdc6-like AAA superfamily ATPase